MASLNWLLLVFFVCLPVSWRLSTCLLLVNPRPWFKVSSVGNILPWGILFLTIRWIFLAFTKYTISFWHLLLIQFSAQFHYVSFADGTYFSFSPHLVLQFPESKGHTLSFFASPTAYNTFSWTHGRSSQRLRLLILTRKTPCLLSTYGFCLQKTIASSIN